MWVTDFLFELTQSTSVSLQFHPVDGGPVASVGQDLFVPWFCHPEDEGALPSSESSPGPSRVVKWFWNYREMTDSEEGEGSQPFTLLLSLCLDWSRSSQAGSVSTLVYILPKAELEARTSLQVVLFREWFHKAGVRVWLTHRKKSQQSQIYDSELIN